MEKKIQIEIELADILEWLKSKGISTDQTIKITAQFDGYDATLDFPLKVEWKESLTPLPIFSVNAILPLGVLFNFKELLSPDRMYPDRIACIKEIRAYTRWGLAESKSWLDHNYPAKK